MAPGINTIDAIVSNQWRGQVVSKDVLRLRYRRPPQITQAPKKVEAVETNKVSLKLTVESVAERSLTAVMVDGKPVRFDTGAPEKRDGRKVWTVALPEVFVNDGERNLDRIAVRAATEEGESQPAIVLVEHTKLPRLPAVRFVSPEKDSTSARPEQKVSYVVESERPLQRVEIRRGDEVLHQRDLTAVKPDGKRFTFSGDAEVKLSKGPNSLELVAVNEDGRSPQVAVVVSYNAPSVLVKIDHVEFEGENGKVVRLEPQCNPDCSVTFPQAPKSLVYLIGHVRWSDPTAKALDDRSQEVVVKVGDCRQLPVALAPRGKNGAAGTRNFVVPIALIGTKNRVQVELPSVAQQELSRSEFELTCSTPAIKQRLHVLIVGVDVMDGEALKRRFPRRDLGGRQQSADRRPGSFRKETSVRVMHPTRCANGGSRQEQLRRPSDRDQRGDPATEGAVRLAQRLGVDLLPGQVPGRQKREVAVHHSQPAVSRGAARNFRHSG